VKYTKDTKMKLSVLSFRICQNIFDAYDRVIIVTWISDVADNVMLAAREITGNKF